MTFQSSEPVDRLHGLDALRGSALLLGVVLHAAMAYTPMPMWVVVDSQTSPAAGAVFFAIHLFRMTAFFLIAGLFAHMMIGRRGVGGFIRDRVSRIAARWRRSGRRRWRLSSPCWSGWRSSTTAGPCPRGRRPLR